MGGPRISSDVKKQMRDMRYKGMTCREIADALNVSTYAVNTYTKDIEVDDSAIKLSSLIDTDERLVDIDGYNGDYQVSTKGKVISWRSQNAPCKLKLQNSVKGGYKVVLIRSTDTKLVRVDQLVANAFCKKTDDSFNVVKHIDGNILNNNYDNLQWSKPQERIEEKRERVHLLDDDAVAEVKARWLAGENVHRIADSLGVSVSTVQKETVGLLRDIPEPPCEDGEVWVPIADFETGYYVSSHGRIYSTGRGRRNPKIMAQAVNYMGYKHIHLVDEYGCGRSFPVHRLVAAAFCDGYDELHCIVNHKDGNPGNNRADNLEWCTHGENTRHAINELGIEMGGSRPFETRSMREASQSPLKRKKPSNRRFTDEEAIAIRNDPRSARQLAKELGVNKCTIINIRRGFTYRELP